MLVDGIDSDVYVHREAERSLHVAVAARRNTLLLGEAGTGKTTLLRWLRAQLRSEGTPAAFVNAALADDTSSFADLVADAIEEAIPGPAGRRGPPRKSGDTVPEAVRLLYEVRRLATTDPVVLLVDGLSDAVIAHDWFGRLRDEVWALDHTWVVAARPRDSGPLRTPPADAFWSATVELGKLTRDEIDRMLTHGLDDEERARLVDVPRAGVTPRELVLHLYSALSDAPPAATPWDLERRERARRLGHSEDMVLLELEGIGRPVSAHDDVLLRRLGWSRPYTQRILSRLADAGLVRRIPDRSGGQGRPRTLYEPAPLPSEDG